MARTKRVDESKMIHLYTDGSYHASTDCGGYAAISNHGHVVLGGEKSTTNNKMEITAVAEGLSVIDQGSSVLVMSDSQYVVNAFEKKWLKSWEKNGWKTSAGAPVKNQDEWKRLQEEVSKHKKVHFKWVKGHNGDVGNTAADELANIGSISVSK